jgi:hypothetical protein
MLLAYGCLEKQVRKIFNRHYVLLTELTNLYSWPDIIRQIKYRRMRWAGHVARMGEGRNVYRILMGKPEGKKPHGRQRRRWEVGIRMDLRVIGWRGVE